MSRANVNIAEILQQQGVRLGEKPAIVHGERSISYAELARNVRRRASLFRERGVRPGEAILVVVPMSIELYEIMIGIIHAGAVALFLDAWSDRSRIELARESMPVTGFIGPGRARLLRLVSGPLRSIPHSFAMRLRSGHSGEMREPVHFDDDAPALVTFTTGSTGHPRGANRTHRHLREQQAAIVDAFSPTEDDVDLATLPIFPLSNLAVGSTTVLPKIDFRRPAEFDPDEIVATFARRRVTTAALSPAVVDRLAESSHVEDLPHLRRLLVGGSTITPALAGRVRERIATAELTAVYGSTEAEPISLISFDELLRTSGDDWRIGIPAGYPVERISVRIVSAEPEESRSGVEMPTGVPGEICVSGPHVLKEYVGPRSEWLQKYVEIDGEMWLRTGDGGVMMPDGSLHLLGRLAGRIVWTDDDRTEVLWPLPAEMLLSGIPGVSCGTVVQIGSMVTWVAESDPAVRTGNADLERTIEDALRREGLPVGEIRIHDGIPRDPRHASKIDYRRLIEELSRDITAGR